MFKLDSIINGASFVLRRLIAAVRIERLDLRSGTTGAMRFKY